MIYSMNFHFMLKKHGVKKNGVTNKIQVVRPTCRNIKKNIKQELMRLCGKTMAWIGTDH